MSDIGTIHTIKGELPQALEYYRKALALRESLSAADPKDARVRYALGTAYERIGDVLQEMGQTSAALKHFRKTLENREELVRTDPANNNNQVALADAYERFGYLYASLAKSKGRRELWTDAKSWYEKSLAAFQALAARGALHGADAEGPARIKKNLAECDAALGRAR